MNRMGIDQGTYEQVIRDVYPAIKYDYSIVLIQLRDNRYTTPHNETMFMGNMALCYMLGSDYDIQEIENTLLRYQGITMEDVFEYYQVRTL